MIAELGYKMARIEPPGTLDGGDVLKVDDVVYVGLGGRTNPAGIEQLTALVEPAGRRVVTVPLSKVLHLKSAVTALPDGTIVGWPAGRRRHTDVPDVSSPHRRNRARTSCCSTGLAC